VYVTRSLDDPLVREILTLRRRRYVALSAIVGVVYLIVAAGFAYAPALMSRPIARGSSISLGLLSIAAIMILGIVTSGYYTWWSNVVRDRLLNRLLEPRVRAHE
jgi:uncharacterized membrane protein (DUF485 family)